MKRTIGLSLAITVLAAFGIIQSARSQQSQELANSPKIIARTRLNLINRRHYG